MRETNRKTRVTCLALVVGAVALAVAAHAAQTIIAGQCAGGGPRPA